MFLEEMHSWLERLQVAVAEQNAPAVWQAAHALKGSAGYLGATALQKHAAQLESAAKAGNLAHAPEQLQQMQVAWDKLLATNKE